MNILIVDDDPIIRRLLPAFCSKISKECTALTAKNGEEALKILASEQIDLILTDLEMPVMDGCELVSRVKAQYQDIQIIVMTGSRCDEADKRLRSVGISQYIENPFTVQDLGRGIQSAFKKGSDNPVFEGTSCSL
jgi:CheY-like chemotaxis protein